MLFSSDTPHLLSNIPEMVYIINIAYDVSTVYKNKRSNAWKPSSVCWFNEREEFERSLSYIVVFPTAPL